MKKDETKSTVSQMNKGKNSSQEDVLDRDQPGPVSVSPEGKEKPSYTHNADKTDPIDPHLGGEKSPEKTPGAENVEDDALDRDKPGPVSVSPEGKDKPSYTHNADKTDPLDPNMADQSGYSKGKSPEQLKK